MEDRDSDAEVDQKMLIQNSFEEELKEEAVPEEDWVVPKNLENVEVITNM